MVEMLAWAIFHNEIQLISGMFKKTVFVERITVKSSSFYFKHLSHNQNEMKCDVWPSGDNIVFFFNRSIQKNKGKTENINTHSLTSYAMSFRAQKK